MKQQSFSRIPFRSLFACLTVLALLFPFGSVFALAGPEYDPDTDADTDNTLTDPYTSDPDTTDPDTSDPDTTNPVFSVTLKATGDYYPGGTVSVTATIDGLDGDAEYTGFFFDLTYDPAALTLANELNKDNSLDCITKLPGDKWENLTTADQETGTIRVSVGLTEDLTQATKENGSLVLAFRFTVPNTIPETTTLRIQDDTVSATDKNLATFTGTGTTLTLNRTEAPDLSSSSEPPAAGDAGSVFPFLLGTGALLGLLTAIRLRRREDHTL